jgi:hypothetical protein
LVLGISTRTLRRKLQHYRAARSDGDPQSRHKTGMQQRYFRITADIPVSLTYLEEGADTIKSIAANISSGGMAVRSPIPLKHGSTFELTFQLPGTLSPLVLKAELAWTSPDGLAGLTFVDLHPAAHKELQQWLLTHASAEGYMVTDQPS